MLKKSNRLTRTQFDHAFSIGKRYHSPLVQAIVSVSETFHGAVVVGKKVYKRAVDRNKLRRQIYALLYQWSKNTSIKKTVIIIVKPAIKDITYSEVAQNCKEILEKISKV